ncbi:RDD family protein [Cellulomonas massiliensis]|uniref:RDD family protein n=1 Tax=Cellulomonas massiliensis TaxID=1465811 RepID=UPI0002F281A1|nr:RDD family protein [Cellulomonas massiliensis]
MSGHDPDDVPPGAAARRDDKAWNDGAVPEPDAGPSPTGTLWEPTPTVPFPRPPAEADPTADDTPVPSRPRYAPWTSRAAGWVIDQAVMVVPLLLAIEAAASAHGGWAVGLRVLGVAWAVAWFVGNRVVAQGRSGVTLGRSFLGTRLLLATSRRPCGWRLALWREVLHLLDALWLVGFLRPLWDGRRRTFADSLVQTSVLVDL